MKLKRTNLEYTLRNMQNFTSLISSVKQDMDCNDWYAIKDSGDAVKHVNIYKQKRNRAKHYVWSYFLI